MALNLTKFTSIFAYFYILTCSLYIQIIHCAVTGLSKELRIRMSMESFFLPPDWYEHFTEYVKLSIRLYWLPHRF